MHSPVLSHFTFASDPLQGRCQRWHRSLSKSHSPLGNYKPTGHPRFTPFLLKMQLHTCPSATQGEEQEFTSFLLQIQKTETFGLGGKACFSVKTLFMCAVAFGRMRHDLVQPPLAEMFPEWWEPGKFKGFCYQSHSSQSEYKGETTFKEDLRKQNTSHVLYIFSRQIKVFFFL